MFPIRYQVVGEEDYAVVIEIAQTGEFSIEGGTYTTDKPRKGLMTGEQEEGIRQAVQALGLPTEHPPPEGSAAFIATLTLGTGGDAVTYRFWEGALEQDAELKNLVRQLELL